MSTFIESVALRTLRFLKFSSGSTSVKIRSKLYKKLVKGNPEGLKIKTGVTIDSPGEIVIGRNLSIQDFSFISASGGLTIGDNVSIAPFVQIYTTHHPYRKGIIKANPLEKRPVLIGSNVWIGAGVIILGGSQIGDNVVIGAGTVVSSTLEANYVYAGNPCKKIKKISGI